METFQYRYQRKTQILYHFAVAGVRDCSGEDYDRFDPDIPPAILETIRRPDGLEKAERFSAVRSDFASGFDREELFHRKVYLYAEILVNRLQSHFEHPELRKRQGVGESAAGIRSRRQQRRNP